MEEIFNWRKDGSELIQAEVQAAWVRTREKIGLTAHEEEAYGEFYSRLPGIVAVHPNGEEKITAILRAIGQNPIQEEWEEVSRRLHSQPLSSLREYVKDQDEGKLWAVLFPEWSSMGGCDRNGIRNGMRDSPSGICEKVNLLRNSP